MLVEKIGIKGRRRGEIETDIGEELSLNTSLGFDQYNKVSFIF